MEADFFEYELEALCRKYGRKVKRKYRTAFTSELKIVNELLNGILKDDPTYINVIKEDCWYRLARHVGKELAHITMREELAFDTRFSADLTTLTDQRINEHSSEVIVC